MLKRLFSHTFLYAIGPQVPKLINILILPVITQFLTPVDYGVYGTLLAYTGLLSGIKSMGFEVLLINSFFKKRLWPKYWSRYIGALYFYNILFALVYIVFLWVFIPKEAYDNLWVLIFLIVTPAVLFDTTKMAGSRYFQLRKKPKYIAIVTSIVGVVSIFINLYCIAILKLGYLGWFISIACGSFLTFILYGYPLFIKSEIKPILTFNSNFWKKSLRIGLPVIPHKYASYLLNSSDRLVMDQLHVPINQIGTYNLAYIFGGYIDMLGQAIRLAIGPYYGNMHKKNTEESKRELDFFTHFLQLSFVLGGMLLSLWVKQIFQLLINNETLKLAYGISIFIIMGYCYRPIYWRAMSFLFFHEHTKKLWRVSFIAGAFNVVLNLIFIPIYGIYAAAVTTFISLMYLGIAPYFIKEFKAANGQKIFPFLWIGCIIFCTAIVYVLRDALIFHKLVLSIFLIIGYLIFFFKYSKRLNKINI